MNTLQNKIKYIKHISIATYIVSTILWIVFVVLTKNLGTYEGPLFKYVLTPFLIGMTILPIFGFILCLEKAKLWGGWQSAIGKALISLGWGLLGWAGGMIVWNYYLFFTSIQVPYPSLADAIFILSWPLWAYGIFQLSKATRRIST